MIKVIVGLKKKGCKEKIDLWIVKFIRKRIDLNYYKILGKCNMESLS